MIYHDEFNCEQPKDLTLIQNLASDVWKQKMNVGYLFSKSLQCSFRHEQKHPIAYVGREMLLHSLSIIQITKTSEWSLKLFVTLTICENGGERRGNSSYQFRKCLGNFTVYEISERMKGIRYSFDVINNSNDFRNCIHIYETVFFAYFGWSSNRILTKTFSQQAITLWIVFLYILSRK